jgi:hypothetical protein
MIYPSPPIYPADHPISIPYEIRDQHIYIPGKTRHGKTTMLHHLIMGDIQNGAGVTVLDPKGNLADQLLDYIPEHRKNDCYSLSLEYPIPLDVMSHKNPDEKENLVGELKYIVTKGDETLKRADAVLTRLFYMLLTVPGTSFLDTHNFFANPVRRDAILAALKPINEERWTYWKHNFPRPDVYDPILTRMTKFIEHPSLRAIFQLSDNPLSIPWVMDNRKILIVNLGGSGESKNIYGSLLVAKFLQTTLRRSGMNPADITPHHLYVDEFERFQTSAFDEIFSIAGGLGLRLTVGNQYIGQLEEKIRASIFGNAGTFIVFKIGEHTDLFKNILYPYDHNLLAQIPKHQAMYKIGDQTPIFKWTRPLQPKPKQSFRAHIVQNTLTTFPANSAQSGEKRVVENSGCDTQHIGFNKGDGNSTNSDPEDDQYGPKKIPPSGRPT